jgi:DNA segregation ATPase FtsK/SpoIIIE, S-DNA-T family
MTARTARTKRSTKSNAKSRKTETEQFRVAGFGNRVLGWFTSIETPAGVRREVSALLALTMAVLLAIVLIQPGDGSLLGFLGSRLRTLVGQGAFMVPLAFLWLAGEALFSENPGTRRRRVLGVGLLSVSVLSFLHMIGTHNGLLAGGHVGSGFAEIVRLIAGEIGAGILLFSVGIVGIYFVTGIDAVGVVQSWRRARKSASHEAALAEVQPASNSAHGKTQAKAQTDDGVEAERPAPVINVPKPAKSASARGKTSAKSKKSDQATADGTPAGPAPLPDLERLTLYEGGTPDAAELQKKAELIEETLGNFKVGATVREIHPGPAVTLFTLKPGPGVKVRRITELQNDLALALAAPSIRIEAPVPGMARVGVEIPNQTVHTVGLRETMESGDFRNSKARLPLSLGRDVNGSYRIADLTRMPHLLIAGSTGSGKSVCINGIIASFLATSRPEDLQMVMIDPKMVELVGFNGVPHLKGPVVTEMDKVVSALRMVLREMEDRYQRFSALGVRNIDGYNLRREEDPSLEKMPYLVVIIDELADLMMTAPDEVESLLVRLAQMARATGIHLLIATQRPSVDVITGLIKANVPARIAFAVTSQTDSRVILDLPGAERLLGKGDMLFLPPDAAKPNRMQGSFIDDKDLQYVVGHWKKFYPNYEYDPEWVELPSASEGDDGGADDDLLEKAEAIVRQQGTASASMLQRRLRIGYNRASRLIEQLEANGLVGPADGPRGRKVFLGDDDDFNE